jgi:hypothetical protein
LVSKYKGNHELLYYFDKGSMLQAIGDYKGSTQFLEKAELKIEELYTKSATSEVTAFLSNDMNLPYQGEDFEQVMVNIMKCLNFMYEGDFAGAQIEARKVNNVLNVINDKYEGKGIYNDDPFARYLSAIAYEAVGTKQELNHAYIDYKKSYALYKEFEAKYKTEMPETLKHDLLRTAHALYFDDDVKKYSEEFGITRFRTLSKLKEKGELIVVVYDGMAPYKKSKFIQAPIKDKEGKSYVVKVAFPSFVSRGHVVNNVEIVNGKKVYNGNVGENVEKLATVNLEHKNGLIKLKAIARATTKFFASRAVSNNGKNKMMALLANIYTYASEQADTRSWRTLPAKFHIVRVPLKPGRQTVNVRLHTVNGGVREVPIVVDMRKGKKTVVPVFAFN